MIPFRFHPHIEKYLRDEAKRKGWDMVQVIEELLEFRAKFKVWPPMEQTKKGAA